MTKFDNQIVYLEVHVPLVYFYCGSGIGTYSLVTELKGSSTSCGSAFPIHSGEFQGGRFECIDINKGEEADWYRDLGWLGPRGGIEFRNTKIFILPFGSDPYWSYEFEPAEGFFEDAVLSFSGLVRVHWSALETEETGTLYLEPIDPNAVGLTWKFENTLQRLANLDSEPADSYTKLVSTGPDWNRVTPAEPTSILGLSSFWDHNGSVMGLHRQGISRQLVYLKPRDKLAALGIGPDTVLFEGTSEDGKWYVGATRTFGRCGSGYFDVSGPVSDDDRIITLRGVRAVWDESCNQVGERDDVLVFEFLGSVATTELADFSPTEQE